MQRTLTTGPFLTGLLRCLCLLLLAIQHHQTAHAGGRATVGFQPGNVLQPTGTGRGLKLANELPEDLRADCDGKDLATRPQRCWLWDYILFHREKRGTPDAKYLVWACWGGNRGADNIYPNDCAGLGDRLRGIEYALRLAAGLNRVLLVHQETPAPMTIFFQPGVIDWRLMDDLKIMINPAVKHFLLPDLQEIDLSPLAKTTKRMLENGGFELISDRVITLSTNYFLDHFAGSKAPEFHYGEPVTHTLVDSLFRLSPQVEERVDKVLADMGIAKNEQYVAFHLRMGHMMGETERQTRHNLKNATDGEVLKLAQQCATRLAARFPKVPGKVAANPPKIVLITDESDLRGKAIKGELWPWVSPNVQPVHFSEPERVTNFEYLRQHDNDDVEKHIQSMVDFGVLVRSTCLILTRSGFSQQAGLMGPFGCHTPLDDCLTYQAPALGPA